MAEEMNIFVVGLNDFNRQRLETLRGAENWRFHGLIAPEAVYDTEEFDIAAMLAEATADLEAFEGSIDAIVGYMDFPVSTMLPILCERFGIRSTSLASLLKCEHKYWSRLVQREVIPAHIPAFAAFDPFDDEAMNRISEGGSTSPSSSSRSSPRARGWAFASTPPRTSTMPSSSCATPSA